MTFEDGLRLVKARAEAMHAAAEQADACMATISGVDDQTLAQMIAQATAAVGGTGRAYVANFMFPEGRTCSGDRQVLMKLCELVVKMGSGKSGKVLPVSGAFHTPYMKEAQEALSHLLDEVPMQPPTINFLANVTGEYCHSVSELCLAQRAMPCIVLRCPKGGHSPMHSPISALPYRSARSLSLSLLLLLLQVENIRELLKRQICEPVQWEQIMTEVIKGWQKISAYVETGPGKQLKAMMRRIDQDAWGKMLSLD